MKQTGNYRGNVKESQRAWNRPVVKSVAKDFARGTNKKRRHVKPVKSRLIDGKPLTMLRWLELVQKTASLSKKTNLGMKSGNKGKEKPLEDPLEAQPASFLQQRNCGSKRTRKGTKIVIGRSFATSNTLEDNRPLIKQEQSKVKIKDTPVDWVVDSKLAEDVASVPINRRSIGTIQRYDKATGKWCKKKDIYTTTNALLEGSLPQDKSQNENLVIIRLRRGGELRIYKNLFNATERKEVTNELLSKENLQFFRQYKIHGINHEPRIHFLAHIHATRDFGAKQPGYRYGRTKMKARPLVLFPMLQSMSDSVAKTCGVKEWNIGVNPVLYRDETDRMGSHADDDQDESLILAVIVASPKTQKRKIRIEVHKKKTDGKLETGDEKIELDLSDGDGYSMDGAMQLHYSHCVAKPAAESILKKRRVSEHGEKRFVVVFRIGREERWLEDSGKECRTFEQDKRPIEYNFGHCGLKEGHVYSRAELLEYGAHLGQQRGLSGNKDKGCNAMIVSGCREDKKGEDTMNELTYWVERRLGGDGVLQSMKRHVPIRVFRSTKYNHAYRAINNRGSKSASMYRYDGLYFVDDVKKPNNPNEEPYTCELYRAQSRCWTRGEYRNKIDSQVFLEHCRKLGTIKDCS